MKTLRKNVQDFKTYMLQEEAKHKELKQIANLSSNNPDYNCDDSSNAKYLTDSNKGNMSIIYIAYYIVKHHLDEAKQIDYLMHIADTYKCWYTWRGKSDYDNILYGYLHKNIMKLVDKYTYEENENID